MTEGSDEGGRRGGRSAYIHPKPLLLCPAVPDPHHAHPSHGAGVELLSALLLSMAFSLVVGVVAGSRTWSDVTCSSGSAAILRTVAPCGNGSSVAAGSGSRSSVGSGLGSEQRGDGGLGSGSGCALDRG